MYKILIYNAHKDFYQYYKNADGEIFGVENLEDKDADGNLIFKTKYEELLDLYYRSQLKIVHEIEPDFDITIEEP